MMTPTHVELYEALKPTVGEDAARMIAEVIPPTQDLATKLDVAGVRAEIAELRGEMRESFADVRGEMREGFAELRGEMREGFAQLRGEMQADRASLFRWMLGLTIPIWASTFGTLVAIVIKL